MFKPYRLSKDNFLSSSDMSTEEIIHILEIAKNFKNNELNIEFNI